MAKQPTPKKTVRSAAREAMNESGGNIISKKTQPTPKATLKKEVTNVKTKGNTTTTSYPEKRTSVNTSNGKKVAVSKLTKVVTKVPNKGKLTPKK